nr:F-box domain, leucine-rich repeat domain, L domain-like protein [Tanacetum cinerariifolium]
MESPDWTEINAGIQQHLRKAYNTNKAAFKTQHWVIDPTIGTYNVEKIRLEHSENIMASDGISILSFGMIPRTSPEPLKIDKTGQSARSYLDRDPGRLLAFEMRWVLVARATASPSTPAHESTLNSLHKKVDFMMSLFKSESKYSDMFSQFELGGASESGECQDKEEGADQ